MIAFRHQPNKSLKIRGSAQLIRSIWRGPRSPLHALRHRRRLYRPKPSHLSQWQRPRADNRHCDKSTTYKTPKTQCTLAFHGLPQHHFFCNSAMTCISVSVIFRTTTRTVIKVHPRCAGKLTETLSVLLTFQTPDGGLLLIQHLCEIEASIGLPAHLLGQAQHK